MLILHNFSMLLGITGHAYKLYTNYCGVNIRNQIFCNPVVVIWNALDAAATDFSTLALFKPFLNTADLSQYLSFM